MATVELGYAVHGTRVITTVQFTFDKTVDQLREAIVMARKWADDPVELTLYLAKDKSESESGWLKDDDTLKKLLEEDIGNKYEEMKPLRRLCKYFGANFEPGEEEIHVLVKRPAPSGARTEVCRFSPRGPKPLVQSDGANWDFQNPLDAKQLLASDVKQHYHAWRDGKTDKRCHPLFLCLDGPGTGKSRLLNEFPSILQHLVFDDPADQEMKRLLQEAFTFKVTLRHGTSQHDAYEPSHHAIGTRMLYQLQSTMEWEEFIAQPAHHVYPSQVLTRLMKITGSEPRQMCVILCVDNLQKLQHEPGSKSSPFYSAWNALCDLVNDSSCWVIAIGSATIQEPIYEFLTISPQWQRQLPTPKLSRPKIHGVDVFHGFGKDDLVQLLIDDMGGFGRCIEVLYSVLNKMRSESSLTL